MEKTVEQKVKECKQVIIQGMEKTLQHKMVYMYLKDRKKDSEVKQFSVNGKDGLIKIEFNDHEKARSFYDEANFIEKILIRPFNIYFNLTLSDAEMKKFYLEGITEENQRKLFEECRKLGFCKLYTSYTTGPRGKLKPNGVLSFIRKDAINENDFKTLSDNLKNLGIKIHTYIHDKGLKCSINLKDFFEGDFAQDESVIQEAAEKKAKQLIKEMTKEAESNLSIVVKKREAVPDKQTPAKVVVTALLEYSDVQKTMDVYEQMREYLVNKGEAKAVLFFHNQENNSYLSLFTPGLEKPKDLTVKQFENKLLGDFKKINPNVVQVNVFAVVYNDTYIGRVYLKTEQDGKDFIIDYSTKRAAIYENYRQKNAPIVFNISIDIKTIRKIKQAEKKARETEDKIKKQSEINRREFRNNSNQMPIPGMQGMQGMIPFNPIPNMQMGGPSMLPINPQTGSSLMPNLMGYPPQGLGNMGGKILPPGMGPMIGMPGAIPVQIDPKNKIKNIIRDRTKFEEMDIQNAKRFLNDSIKYCIEETGVSPSDSAAIANIILKDTDVSILIKYLESSEELKKRIQAIKH